MFVETTTYTHVFHNNYHYSCFLVISFTGHVTTILKFAGSSMIWQIVTKSPIDPMETPSPSITIWSKAANVAALIKLNYLNTILLWLDKVGPKSSSGWKAVIGFNTVCVPSLTPKASVVNLCKLLDPTQICLKRKQLEGKSNEGDGHLSETVPTANASTRSESVLDEEESPGVPAESLKQVGDETLGQNQKDKSTIAKDDNDDKNCKDSYNDEGQKTANDDSAVTVSKPNIGEDDEGDGCFNESITKADKSTISDKITDADPSTVVPEKEGGDETKGHDDNVDDNGNKSDNDEGVISSNADPCMAVSPQRLEEESSSVIKGKESINEKVNSLVSLGEFAELHNPIIFTSLPSYIFYFYYDNP